MSNLVRGRFCSIQWDQLELIVGVESDSAVKKISFKRHLARPRFTTIHLRSIIDSLENF